MSEAEALWSEGSVIRTVVAIPVKIVKRECRVMEGHASGCTGRIQIGHRARKAGRRISTKSYRPAHTVYTGCGVSPGEGACDHVAVGIGEGFLRNLPIGSR